MPLPAPPSQPREAKLFRNNRSQAIRIPVEFELPGDRVLIRRDGSKLIIEPIRKPTDIHELLAVWKNDSAFGSDDLLPDIDDLPPSAEDIL
ncbi:antitoxin [Gluconobacter oxydans]|uniref:antitoxin n=1 Tax=Gluconobacter oxydans TaxID=442 RepID=UPI0039E7EF5E